jgi:CHASE3 domain sensor protein
MQTSFNKKMLNNFLIFAIAFVTICNLIAFGEYQNLFKINGDVIESYLTIRAANQTLISVNEASQKVSSFLFAGDNEGINNLPQIIISAQVNLATLKQLTADNAEQTAIYNNLKSIIDQKISYLNNVYGTLSSGNRDAALQLASDKKRFQLTTQIGQSIIDIKKIEANQLEDNHNKFISNLKIANALFLIIGTFSIALLIFCFYLLNNPNKFKF